MKNKCKVAASAEEKYQKRIIGLYLITLWILIGLSPGVIATPLNVSEGCVGVLNIYANSARCDNMTVSAKGIVSEIEFKIATTENSNPYTVFQLSDGASKLQVFSFTHVDVRRDDIVEVVGVFHEMYTTSTNHIITNQIISDPDLIKVIRRYFWYEDYRILSIIAFTLLGLMISRKKIAWLFKKPVPPLRPVDESISNTDSLSNRSDEQDSRVKGDMFEEYIISLLDRSNVSIERTKERDAVDILVKRFNPMFTIAIECKYRSELKEWHGRKSFEICERKEMNKYRIYQKTKNTKVLFFCGLGGSPNNPSDIFIIPLDRIKEGFSWYPEFMLREFKLKDKTNKITFDDLLRWLPQNPIQFP